MTPLATLLAHIGWTTGELARRLSVTDGTVRNWVTGRRSPSLSVLVWLAEVADAVASVDSQPAGWEGVRVNPV